jgi:hypothetical protein
VCSAECLTDLYCGPCSSRAPLQPRMLLCKSQYWRRECDGRYACGYLRCKGVRRRGCWAGDEGGDEKGGGGGGG